MPFSEQFDLGRHCGAREGDRAFRCPDAGRQAEKEAELTAWSEGAEDKCGQLGTQRAHADRGIHKEQAIPDGLSLRREEVDVQVIVPFWCGELVQVNERPRRQDDGHALTPPFQPGSRDDVVESLLQCRGPFRGEQRRPRQPKRRRPDAMQTDDEADAGAEKSEDDEENRENSDPPLR